MANDKLALVTGAAGGIGFAVCDRLVRDGYRIAALDLDGKGLQRLKDTLRKAVATYETDQTREDDVRATVAAIERDLGAVSALVNVLGWTGGTRFDQEDAAYWNKVVALNYMALLYVAHPVLQAMIGRKRGKMVFVASDAGRSGASGQAVYAGAKGAVIAFAKSLARENARHNITVNCIAPGPTETPLFQHEQKEHPETVDRIVKAIPLRRAALPAEQAGAISFLLSPDGDYITGQTLSVSGGLSMI
jgi:2-hydroxycyclohexanecarboxyl-CoA dehydrogenase